MTEEPKMTEKDLHKALFMNLVMMLATSAMQQMGKLVNPATQKAEMNLEGAQVTIDMLVMLQQKTKGNLDTEEQGLIDQSVSSLQLTYVDTARSAPPADKKQPPAAETAKPDAAPAPDAAPDAKQKDPKFRKSYGA